MFGRAAKLPKHQCLDWRIVRRVYNPPRPISKISTWGIEGLDVSEILYGFTTIEERCGSCGRSQFTRVLGNQTLQPRERRVLEQRRIREHREDQATPGEL